MHFLIIEKTTNKILQSRVDNATVNPMNKEQALQTYCKDNNIDPSVVEVVEIPFTAFLLHVGKHIFVNNQIEVDPNWVEPEPVVVEPPPEEAPAE